MSVEIVEFKKRFGDIMWCFVPEKKVRNATDLNEDEHIKLFTKIAEKIKEAKKENSAYTGFNIFYSSGNETHKFFYVCLTPRRDDDGYLENLWYEELNNKDLFD